jgi:DNA-binding transcriptional LysR family regulator
MRRREGASAALLAAPFAARPPLCKWLDTQLASIGPRPRNVVARPPYMEVARQMTASGLGLAVLFDEHAASLVESRRLKRVQPMPVAAYRVMMLGRRALQPNVAPALAFLRRVACIPPMPKPTVRHASLQLVGT